MIFPMMWAAGFYSEACLSVNRIQEFILKDCDNNKEDNNDDDKKKCTDNDT
jgi:hypothetical protein